MYDIFMNDAMFDADNMMEENNFEIIYSNEYTHG